ncbi:Astacin (Peptidase M12A) [Parelaphostrongylus tenuis]|uniref:Metalloendopeptidase n=1 Tax=Parelaphostrongylus tenuis TaxID=148309 RepID=A0AAD5RES6_PARTN|nr:Astacin (Peptidase M12A) [Parelaphostrongylus tenuis]
MIPNEEGTVRFLKQLHNMEKELKNRLVQSAHVLPSEIMGIGCYSALGRTGGVQPLSLGPRCERVGTAVHEIGHALGFFHTHSRHDRDSFIAVHPDNFQDGWLSQFTKISEGVNYNYQLTYDYGSVMHYGALRLASICPSSDIIEGS